AMAATEKEMKKRKNKGKKKKKVKKKKRRKKKKKKKKRKKRKNKKKKKKKSDKKEEKIKKEDKEEKTTSNEPSISSGQAPDNYVLKHRPCHQEGLLWLARTYIERGEFDEAELLLNKLEYDAGTFDDIRKSVAPVRAHFFMTQKKYQQAVAPLEKAIANSKNKERGRYAYILGQIQQHLGNDGAAYAAFEQAVKFSPSYEMEFSSRLNLAQNGYRSGQATAEDTQKVYSKMLKDVKNVEYLDQIFYAMAGVAIQEKNENEAIAYLKKSLLYNKGNIAQKTESYLQLAEYFFANEDFVNAKNYYDSTAQVMPKTDERYASINKFNNNLTDIAKNIGVITLSDSLLMISAMTDEQRKELAGKIKKAEEEARRLALLAGDKPSAKSKTSKGPLRLNGRSGSARGPNTKSSFPFYADERIKKRGARDFERKWGKRALEDNWRGSSGRGDGDEEVVQAKEAISFKLTDEDVERIFADVPTAPEDIEATHLDIQDALLALGILYRDRLENNEKAVESLEKLLADYPTTKHEEEALYNLHLAYTDLGNPVKAKEAYDRLMEKYKAGTFARVLIDPNYLNELNDEERKLTNYYNETFFNFQKGNYQDVQNRVVEAVGTFGPSNIYQPKFGLLSAMSMGNLKGKEAYVKGLKEVIAKHPDTPEETRAKEILRLLNADKNARDKKKKKDKGSKSDFKLENLKLHYFIVALTGGKDVKLSDAKNKVSDYNRKYHKLDKLRISNVMLGSIKDGGTPVLVIRRFKNKDDAMRYLDSASKNGDDFLKDTPFEMYPITQFNYRLVLKEKSLENYKKFYEENYQ
ncbi:MAG: tetratricopeptide (TPR) repeat protein, partial [Patescibacteria group bacterium]